MLDPFAQSLQRQRKLDMLRALRGLRQSNLKYGQWRTECNLQVLAKIVGLDVLSTADLFRSLVQEGYLRGWVRREPEARLSRELRRVRIFAEKLSGVHSYPTVAVETFSDKAIEQLGVSPELDRRLDMLRALRGLRQSNLKYGQWRTECNLQVLAKIVGLDVLSTADLFRSLVQEGYLRGHLLYKHEHHSDETVRGDSSEYALASYEDLSSSEKRSAHPARAEVMALTEKGLVAIDELPAFDGQDKLPDLPEAGVPESTSGRAEVSEDDLSHLKDESVVSSEEVTTTPAPGGIVNNVFNLGEKAASAGEKAADPAAFKLAPVVGALAGFVGLLIPLAYPAGLITLWIELSNEFGYGFWRALYAASLAPSAVVVGKISWIIGLSLLSALIPMWFWYAYARTKVRKEVRDIVLKRAKRRVIRFFTLYTALLVTAVALLLILALVPGRFFIDKPHFLEGKWTLVLLLGFLGFTVAEVVVGGAILFHRGIQLDDTQASRGPLYLGLAVVYVGSVAAGICLAGLQYPALPTTTLTFTQSSGAKEVQTTKTVGLLSNYSSYWYVVDYCAGDKFLAIPNSRVEVSDAKVEEPSIVENEGAEKTCDTTPPNTTIESGPSGTVDSVDDKFVFSSNEKRSTFQCSIDGKPYASCTSPKGYSGLSDGEHTFSVHAVDAAGNEDDSPVTRRWRVDTTPPNTTIESGPSGTVANSRAHFVFASSEKNNAFECKLDTGSYTFCTFPQNHSGLSDGKHTFSVKATDGAGNTDDTPALRTFLVDTLDPNTTINSGPRGMVTSADASFDFSSSEKSSTFKCSLDGGDYAQCDPSHHYTGLSDGKHTFSVKATDSAGNTDDTSAQRVWTVC